MVPSTRMIPGTMDLRTRLPTVKENNSRKQLAVQGMETMEFDVVAGAKGAEAAKVTGPAGPNRQVTLAEDTHIMGGGRGGSPRDYQQNNRNSESEGKKEGWGVLPKTRPDMARHRGPEHSIPTFLCRGWRLLTTGMQENTVDQRDRICIATIDYTSAGAVLTKGSLARTQ